MNQPTPPISRCKRYHRALKADSPGHQRAMSDRKSSCPGWADDDALKQCLLDDALVDPDGGQDFKGRPKRLWNAINGWYFVAVSTNEEGAAYNCYPEEPSTLFAELEERAQRSVADVLGAAEKR
jgi:hypothetical protein